MRHAILISVMAALFGSAALADHPGERLNEVTAEKEPGFEAISRPGPGLDLVTMDEETLGLEDFAGRILVINFRPVSCTEVCDAQHQRLAKAVTSLNASPMREMVSFVTAVEDEANIDMRDAENWSIVRSQGGLEGLEARLAAGSERSADEPMLYIFDRQGRHVGIFHGTDFEPLNLLMHINGLTNAHPHPEPEGFLDKALGWFK
ncbi:MAG: SCO family protein [Limimaricola soesokkakensis]|uniref:SCO family protein n=1 Tax=Limimaricola soesokkakensis TaxID=1343159 RepID=UPI0040581D5B